ncbi:Arm DNA-binding domain-containing protein [Lysinibacillus pakistanensis]
MKDNIKSYTKKDGKTYYMCKIYLGMDSETGKQIHVTRRGFLTKKEANLALAQLRVEVSKGEYKKPKTETYEDIYNVWIQHYERTVEESTFVKTLGIFRNHILPALLFTFRSGCKCQRSTRTIRTHRCANNTQYLYAPIKECKKRNN